MRLSALRAFVLLLAAACGGPSTNRPAAAVDAYAAALAAGDYNRAYDLMSARYRREHTREDFVAMLGQSPTEVRETAARLRAGARRVEVSARLQYGDLGDELLIVEEHGEWRIGGDPLDFYPQDTPAKALRSFLRAVRAQRYDVVLRFVPDEYRRLMTADQVKRQFEGKEAVPTLEALRLLAASLDNPIEQQGDSARMPFGERYEVKFKREDGDWKIEDPF